MDVYQRRRLVALSVLAGLFIVVVLLIRSCGGADEAPITALATGVSGATGAGGTPLSQQDYVKQADSVCLQANTSLSSLDSSDPSQSATDEAQIVSGELQQLQTLTLAPGEKGADQLDAFLSALDKQAAALLDLSVAAERGDDSATADIQASVDQAASDAAAAARKFGFDACGDSSQVDSSSGGSGGATAVTPTTAVPTTPTTTAPIVPTTPTTAAPAPAPTDGGGAAPAPAPAPTDGGGGSDSGGVTP